MVTSRLEILGEGVKESLAVVLDERRLAVNDFAGEADLSRRKA